jgi:hypothetical protein
MSEYPKSTSPDNAPERIWILGAGHFGSVACKRLTRRYPQAEFLVIDSDRERLAKIEQEFGLQVYLGEAISCITAKPLVSDVWIIPAIPIHVAFQWLLNELKRTVEVEQIDVPAAIDQMVPNPFRMHSKTLYTSFATFVCPDVCNEPDDLCTYTGKPRPGDLSSSLSQMQAPGFHMALIRSWQLAPGVGGYRAGELTEMANRIKMTAGSYLVATSCRCHGVIDALRWKKASHSGNDLVACSEQLC